MSKASVSRLIFVWCAILFFAAPAAFSQTKKVSGFVDVSGGKLYYEVAGKGKAIVLIHGGLVDSRLWNDQFDEFAKNYRVVRYDIRGHGRSPLPTEPYSLVEDVNELLKFLKIERANVVGLSLGGIIAADFALEYPEKTETLILVSAGLRGFEPTKPDEAASAIFRRTRTVSAEEASRLWLEHQFFAGLKNQPARRERMRLMIVGNFQAYAKLDHARLYQLPETQTIKRLDKINAPTLVINGDLDQPNLIATGQTLKQKIPHAEYVLIKGTSHHPNLEKPQEFNKILRNFLRENVK